MGWNREKRDPMRGHMQKMMEWRNLERAYEGVHDSFIGLVAAPDGYDHGGPCPETHSISSTVMIKPASNSTTLS